MREGVLFQKKEEEELKKYENLHVNNLRLCNYPETFL